MLLPELHDATTASKMAVMGTAFIDGESVLLLSCIVIVGVDIFEVVEFSGPISATILITDESYILKIIMKKE